MRICSTRCVIAAYDAIKWNFHSFQLLVKGTVFARMSPDQKAQLVIGLQKLGYV